MAGCVTAVDAAQGQQPTHQYHQRPKQQYGQGKPQSGRRRRTNTANSKHTTFKDDQQQSSALESCLKSQGNQPLEDDDALRLRALEGLEALLNRWATSIRTFQHKNMTAETNKKWTRPKVCLIPFGSYRLGAYRKDADLDCLCLSPPNASRGEFFSSLVKQLNEDDRVSQVHAIASAYTPVIKFVFEGIHIDLLFARLEDGTRLSLHQSMMDGKRIEYHIEDSDLIGLDEASVRSLNGARVAQSILSLVPNIENFRTTLRAVKEWALVHGLYSNVLGFLGGINWAILVALICKRHLPTTPSATLLKAFFHTFAEWKWPLPVMLRPPWHQPPPGVLPMAVWNAKTNVRDAQCIMPILTPCYPGMNSSYNVGVPQLRRMQLEFSAASLIVHQIEEGQQTWDALFHGNDFFNQHIHFLQVNISADNNSSFVEWFRFCESRLRLLIAGMEAPEYGVHVFPFAKFFYQRFDQKGQYLGLGMSDPDCRQTASFFVALRFAYGVETVDLRFCTSEFLHKVNTWDRRRQGMDLTIELVRKGDLPSFTSMEGPASEISPAVESEEQVVPANEMSKDEDSFYIVEKPTVAGSNDERIHITEDNSVEEPLFEISSTVKSDAQVTPTNEMSKDDESSDIFQRAAVVDKNDEPIHKKEDSTMDDKEVEPIHITEGLVDGKGDEPINATGEPTVDGKDSEPSNTTDDPRVDGTAVPRKANSQRNSCVVLQQVILPCKRPRPRGHGK